MKKILLFVTALVFAYGAKAQNVTNSPYSQYGYGQLCDQANGSSKAMGGLGLGWRQGNQVNFSNPASYSAIDSLTFLFDAGLSIQVTNFTEGNHKLNANNSSFDYVVGGFRLKKHLGLAFGVMPFSNVGYSYYDEKILGNSSVANGSQTTYTNTYNGSGGFRQVFVGIGFEPLHLKNTSLSLGANVSYLWGDYNKSIVNSYSNAYVNTLSKYYKGEIDALKLDFGVQLEQKLTDKDKVTVGATYSMKQGMEGNPECLVVSTNSQTGVSDSTKLVANGKYYTPMSYGVGLVWNHSNRWRVGFDYKTEQWGDLNYPIYSVSNNAQNYEFQKGYFKNRQKYTLGGEYCINETSRRWFNRVKFRAGVSYSTPYLVINGQDGPKQISATFGFGLPITNSYNNRSMLNISAGWSQLNATNMIKENTFCINIGLTFNERWFAKWKLQ